MSEFAISYHPFVVDQEKLKDPDMVRYFAAKFSENFLVYRTNHLQEICEYIAMYDWSPIIFYDGKRKEANFSSCNMLALDFDSGKKIVDVIDEIEGYQYVIGTTKSHSEKKNKFRLLIPFAGKFTSLFDYKFVMKYMTRKYGSDNACVDGARSYFPCTKIVAFQTKGKLMEKVVPKDFQEPIENYNFTYDRRFIPGHIKRFITNGESFGAGRNQSCFIAAMHLKKAGYSDGEILSMIEGGAGPRLIGPDFSESELKAAIKSGLSRVIG